MVTIDNELVTFKNNVSPSLGTMNSYTSELKDKISNLTEKVLDKGDQLTIDTDIKP